MGKPTQTPGLQIFFEIKVNIKSNYLLVQIMQEALYLILVLVVYGLTGEREHVDLTNASLFP